MTNANTNTGGTSTPSGKLNLLPINTNTNPNININTNIGSTLASTLTRSDPTLNESKVKHSNKVKGFFPRNDKNTPLLCLKGLGGMVGSCNQDIVNNPIMVYKGNVSTGQNTTL